MAQAQLQYATREIEKKKHCLRRTAARRTCPDFFFDFFINMCPLYMCPHTTICVLILLFLCPHTAMSIYYVCLHTTIYLPLIILHMCPHTTICVLILLHVSSY